MKHRMILLALLTAPIACSPPPADRAIVASAIGESPRIVDPSHKPLAATTALLLSQTAQGLVRFDAAGQIEPGLAIRWDVSDDGLYYTFRLADTGQIDAEQAARWLRAAIGPTSRNPLKPVLGAIAEIVAVTPEVIEIRLVAPRPDLLSLLAQPELAILADGKGTGPFRIASRGRRSLLLAAIDPPGGESDPGGVVRSRLTLVAETAARAVARFDAGRADLVLGGGFADIAIARAGPPRGTLLRIDPASGLFGLAVATRGGFVGVADNRRALAMAIDRGRIAALFGTGWRPASTIVPAGLPDRAAPSTPDWIDTPLDRRRAIARAAVAGWVMAGGTPPAVRLTMPKGPGGRMLFAVLKADWAAIGVTTIAAADDGSADLLLIDRVAPGESASWYLRQFECVRSVACSEEADRSLTAARVAPTLAGRAARLADADARLAAISAFIPIAQPLRWSLVAAGLTAFQENRRAAHPLDQLRP